MNPDADPNPDPDAAVEGVPLILLIAANMAALLLSLAACLGSIEFEVVAVLDIGVVVVVDVEVDMGLIGTGGYVEFGVAVVEVVGIGGENPDCASGAEGFDFIPIFSSGVGTVVLEPIIPRSGTSDFTGFGTG